MSNHQQVTIVRDTAESNNEVDALAQAQAQAAESQPQSEVPPQETPDRPGWLPEKFQSAEDLAKAYSELERKVGTKAVDFSSMDKYTTEFNESGDLSEESVKAISTNMGIPEQIVRAYVDGQKAVLQSNMSQIMSIAGGEKQYESMTSWAAENMPEAEIDAFNEIMDSGNLNTIRLAVQGLKSRYEQTNGTQGRLIQGETTGLGGGAYRSVAEIVSAMKDPRYAKDPAYRKDVEQRVALSNALGVRQ